jgi:hypothetical protein
MAKIKVKITKARNLNGNIVNVGDEIEMDKSYFEVAGKRFSEKIGESNESKESQVEDEKQKKGKKKYKDKEMVSE